MNRITSSIPTVLAALLLTATIPAQAAGEHGAHRAGAAASAGMAEGEVRKVDAEAGKVTLKHGEIKNLDMPGMTMVFTVKDKAMLTKLKTGDKIRFKAVNDAGTFTVTEIQPAH